MIVVYTALFGASDTLKPAPPADQCVCFTDDPSLPARGWDVRVQTPPPHARTAARHLKLRSHELFPDADRVVWADASIEVRDLDRLLEDAGDAELACLAHPDRSTCYEEGATVARLQIAEPPKIEAALAEYRAAGFVPHRLSTTGLLLRRQTPRVAEFNRIWRTHLDEYGTNDQVHVDFCAWRAGIEIRYLAGHYRDNPYMVYDQRDHHRRRRSQFKREADCR